MNPGEQSAGMYPQAQDLLFIPTASAHSTGAQPWGHSSVGNRQEAHMPAAPNWRSASQVAEGAHWQQ